MSRATTRTVGEPTGIRAEQRRGDEPAATVTTALKAGTRDAHARAERALMARLGSVATGESRPGRWPSLSLRSYADVLARLWRVYAGHEAAIRSSLSGFDAPPDMDRRWRVPLLERDLRSLGAWPPRAMFDGRQRASAPSNIGQWVGMLYVSEGAALGGRILARLVPQLPGADVAEACTFFVGNGEDTDGLWESFRQWADRAVPEDRYPSALESARNVFDAITESLEREV